jgi:hypothetical protein
MLRNNTNILKYVCTTVLYKYIKSFRNYQYRQIDCKHACRSKLTRACVVFVVLRADFKYNLSYICILNMRVSEICLGFIFHFTFTNYMLRNNTNILKYVCTTVLYKYIKSFRNDDHN